MLNRLTLFALVLLLVAPFVSAQDQTQTQPQSALDLDLVKSLSSKLAVKPEQAAGAAGAIFGLAKSRLSADDFTKLSASVPGMDLLLKAAPAAGAMSQLAGGNTGLLGLAGSFKQLGLSPDMVGKFVPEILSFVEGKGGSAAKALLGNVLK